MPTPVDVRDVSDCLTARYVLFIWDGQPVRARVTGTSADCPGLLTVTAPHPVTGVEQYKRVWRADVIPAPADTVCPFCRPAV